MCKHIGGRHIYVFAILARVDTNGLTEPFSSASTCVYVCVSIYVRIVFHWLQALSLPLALFSPPRPQLYFCRCPLLFLRPSDPRPLSSHTPSPVSSLAAWRQVGDPVRGSDSFLVPVFLQSCGMGVSSRVTNDNARCKLIKETRLCNRQHHAE